MKRGLLVFILIFGIFLLSINFIRAEEASSDNYIPCCCNLKGWEILNPDGLALKRGTCGHANWVLEDGANESCEEDCLELYGDNLMDSAAGMGCSDIENASDPEDFSKCKPYCGNFRVDKGEECDPPTYFAPPTYIEECGKGYNSICFRDCTCKKAEICNGEDDDIDGYADNSNDCEPYECLADKGDCPLGYVCMNSLESPLSSELPVIAAGYAVRGITGRVGDDKQCQICKSICKVCPPHPPEATRSNPLGICAPEKDGGYPMSKNCLDWKNKVSCWTCVDKDGDGKRETFEARKNDGKFGVDMNNKPIFREGDVVKSTITEVVFPEIKNPEKNKDFKKEDKVIDCRLAIPTLPSGVDESDPISEANALTGVCSNNGICEPRPLSSCMTDCYWEWEVGWKDEENKLTTKDLQKGDGDDIKLTDTCPYNERNSKNAKGNMALKRDGPWGELLGEEGPDCAIRYKTWWYAECKTLNGKVQEKPFPAKELRDKCIKEYGEKNAYFYAILGGKKYGRGQTNCICKKATRDLEVWPEVAMLFELKSITEIACADPASFNCPLTVIYVLQDRKAPQDEVASAFSSLRKWILAG